jgi:aminomethyltransferase
METETSIKRVGFTIDNGPPAREDAKIYSNENNQIIIGKVTSGTFSPSLKKPVGMAYIDAKYAKIGTQLKVSVRNKDYNLAVSKMPFVPQRYYKKKA